MVMPPSLLLPPCSDWSKIVSLISSERALGTLKVSLPMSKKYQSLERGSGQAKWAPESVQMWVFGARAESTQSPSPCMHDLSAHSLCEYLKLQNPLYERRDAIISGSLAPTTEEFDPSVQVSLKDDSDYTPLTKDALSGPATIPEFWLTAPIITLASQT